MKLGGHSIWPARLCCWAAVAAVAGAESLLTAAVSVGGHANCTSGTLAIPVTAENVDILYEGPADGFQATQLLLELSHRNSTVAQHIFGGPTTIDASFSVYAKLCVPTTWAPATHGNAVHLLTHGGTLDHTYWDIAPGYSYVDAAAAAGYATLSYDRVGSGRSAHPDPLQVVQSGVHVEVVHALARMLRDEGMAGHVFDYVAAIGHSVGSWFTHAAADKYPHDLDAVILTGVSGYMGHAMISIASCAMQVAQDDPSGKFSGLARGYLTPAPLASIHQFNFYNYPHFDGAVFQAQLHARQTISIGELLTILQCARPSTYTGPVDVVTGERDFVCCGGNCRHQGDMVARVQPEFIPGAHHKSRSFMVPDTGHNINGYHRAAEAFEQIFEFLLDSGFGSRNSHLPIHDDL